MKKSFFLKITAITFLMAGIVFCGCSKSNDEPIEPVGPKTYSLTIEASKGGDAKTRALTPGETSLVSTWETSDLVYVTKSGASSSCGSLQPKSSGATATLSGKITGEFAQGDELTFQYPRENIDYTGQIGTLADISGKYDYSKATATVDVVGTNAITVTGFSGFENQQAIVKFILKDVYGYSVNATSLKVSATGLKTSGTATGDITVTPTSATDEFYVALSGISSTTVSLTATAETDTYVYEKSNVTFTNGKYYVITVKMKSAMLDEPLTFEAVKEGETTITFSNGDGCGVEFSCDGGDSWHEYTSSSLDPLNKGDKVSFRLAQDASNPSYYSDSDPIFQCDQECYVYGNMMSLVDPTNYATATTLEEGVTFWGLFMGNVKIMSHPHKPLLLPATTLSPNCYKTMFYGCSNLERAPVLPASTLVAYCYESMFTDCDKLNYIRCLATSIGATGCTTNWVNGVEEEGTFVKAATADWSSKEDGCGIPESFTVISE